MEELKIGDFSKRVLLTGAGFSKNFGGMLASEFYNDLVIHPKIRANRYLKDLLNRELNFENALAKARKDFVKKEDVSQLEGAVFDLFTQMEDAYAENRGHHGVNVHQLQRFFRRFWGFPRGDLDRKKSGYLFTLNQDCLFERIAYNWDTSPDSAPMPTLPGIPDGHGRSEHGYHWFEPDVPKFAPGMLVDVPRNPQMGSFGSMPWTTGQNNYIKLHGSFNWRSADEQKNLMVIGGDKANQIGQIPLFNWYHGIFREVLHAGDVRLFVIGHSFSDDHINRIIQSAVKTAGLQMFVANNMSAGAVADLMVEKFFDGPGKRASKVADETTAVPEPLAQLMGGNSVQESGRWQRVCDAFFD